MTTRITPDSRLIARAADGDRAAREALFRRHWRAVWRRAYAVAGSRALADDVTQDVFEKAFRDGGQFQGRGALSAWLGRMATNRAIDELRRSSRLVELDGDLAAPEWSGPTDPEGVRDAVARLDVDQRVAVVLRYWCDFGPEEIAAELDVPVGTVHSRLARGLGELRLHMNGEDRADG